MEKEITAQLLEKKFKRLRKFLKNNEPQIAEILQKNKEHDLSVECQSLAYILSNMVGLTVALALED